MISSIVTPSFNAARCCPRGEGKTLDAIFGRRVLQDERRPQIGRHPLVELVEIGAFAGGLY
jgi:hypothetical protein